MKIKLHISSGSVLVTTLIIAGLAALMLAAQLTMVGHQNYLTMRSQRWNAEIPLAEAGIEEAICHLNITANVGTNGWVLNDAKTAYTKARTFEEGYFLAEISVKMPRVVRSIGYGRIPFTTNYTLRTIEVQTQPQTSGVGILAVEQIVMSGDSVIDAYDSSDPLYSTNGRYDPDKAKDTCGVGSLSPLTPAIDTGAAVIYGYVATPEGGTVEGTVGEGDYVEDPANKGTIQLGHSYDDLVASAPDVSVPFTNGYFTLEPPSKGKTELAVLGGDYKVDGNFTLAGSTGMRVVGAVRMYVTGDVLVGKNSYILIEPGASLELYIGGIGTFNGKGIVNLNSGAGTCSILGLPTCTQITYAGSVAFTGVINAPQANLLIKGTPDIYGSVTARTIDCRGNMGIHYDESLGKTKRGRVKILRWEEL
jgi:hypothetical protein